MNNQEHKQWFRSIKNASEALVLPSDYNRTGAGC